MPRTRWPILSVVLLSILSGCGEVSRTQLEIIVPFREGGGTDQWARALAPYLQRHLGDSMVIQVVNMPGASGLQGGNVFELRRPHDGNTLFVSSGSNVFPQLLGEPAVRYDFNRFRGIVGSPTGGVVYASADLGVGSVEELCATDALLVYGGVSPTGLDLVPLLAFELLGLDVLEVLGYGGKGAARLAFEQGETNLDYQTSPAYLANVRPLVEEGLAVPLFTFGMVDDAGRVVRDPVFPELPSLADAYRTCRSQEPGGVSWDAYRSVLVAGFAAQKNLWVHADAPEDAVQRLTEGARAAVNDPEFQVLADRLLGGYPFYVGAEVDRAFSATFAISDDALAWLVDFLTREYDVRLPA